MSVLLTIAGWAAGWLITARLLFVLEWRQLGGTPPGGFLPTFLGLLWPLWLAIAVVSLPFLAAWWLISRPVRPRD